MTPAALLDLLLIAANAQTDEEKARVAWRASDYMWRNWDRHGIGFCRAFNNLCQDQQWPWVKDLWTQEEVEFLLTRMTEA
jgi:predicted lipoprotein